MSRIVILFFALSGVAAAQSTFQVDVGVRGGLLANKSFEAGQFCVDTACAFTSSTFTPEGLYGTFGPAAGIRVKDRVEVRFEAVHRRFGYEIRTENNPNIVPQHVFQSTLGHLWEFPLLAAYHFGSGPVRPFAGGGIGFGTSGSSTIKTLATSTRNLPGGPVTTSSSDRGTFALSSKTVYYVITGIEGRISYLSIQPEFRYSRFPNEANSGAETILKPNQFEFLVGLSVHFPRSALNGR